MGILPLRVWLAAEASLIYTAIQRPILSPQGVCEENALCVNKKTVGNVDGYECVCKDGWKSDGLRSGASLFLEPLVSRNVHEVQRHMYLSILSQRLWSGCANML